MIKKKAVKNKIVKTKTIKKSAVKKTSPQKKSKYFLTLEVNERIFATNSDSIVDGLNVLKEKLGTDTVKTKAVLNVSDGSKKAMQVMYPFQIKRLLIGSVNKTIFEKRALLTMK